MSDGQQDERVKPTVCDCGHAGLHVNDYGCIQWLRSELKAANRKIALAEKGRDEAERLCNIWRKRADDRGTLLTALEERLRVAVETISSLERIVPYHEDCHDPCPLKGAHKLIRTALAKLKPTAEGK